MNKLVIGTVVGALVIALIGAGCGDDGDSSMTKAEFVKQANIICAQAEGARQALLKKAVEELPPNGTLTPAAQRSLLNEALPGYRKMGEEVEEIAPESEQAQVEKLVAEMNKSADEAEASKLPPGTGEYFVKANQRAKENGLTKCVI